MNMYKLINICLWLNYWPCRDSDKNYNVDHSKQQKDILHIILLIICVYFQYERLLE